MDKESKLNRNRFVGKKRFLFYLFVLLSSVVFAQNKNLVTGTVVDSKGDPVIGAMVLDKSKKTSGTITDINGNFSLKVASYPAQFTVTYIGMKPKEFVARSSNSIRIALEDAPTMLDEVVSTGYATSKRIDLTGAVSSISEKVLKDIPVNDALDAIKGRVSGLNIVRSDGSPDADYAITLRGGGSITQDNTPLFIVDGFQVNDIKDIPPRDILSIDVLKDAASTAIYGSQGANGVILITTKRGQTGRTNITFTSQLGFNKVYNLTPVLSPYEYVYYQRELDQSDGFFSNYGLWSDLNIYKAKKGSDWQNQLFGTTGIQQSYNFSINGGDKTMNYNVSYTHDDENYTLKSSNYYRDNLSVKFNRELNKNLHFDFSSRLSTRVVSGPSVSSGAKLSACVKYAPVKTLNDLSADDIIAGSEDMTSSDGLGTIYDPYSDITNTYSKVNYYLQNYNSGITWDILRNFKFRTQGQISLNRDYSDQISLVGTKDATNNGGMPLATRTDIKGQSWQIQNILTYENTFNRKHRVSAVAGQEATSFQTNYMYAYSKYYPTDFTANDILAMWSYGGSQTASTTIGEPTRTSSYFGRVNYTYDNRYLFTFTARADGKNVFAPEHRWGFFPGAAFAWRVNQEKFLQNQKDWLSNLKLRLSYGEVGNARVSPNWRQELSPQTTQNQMLYINESQTNVLISSKVLYNKDLTWETKISENVGLDFGLFNEKISGTVELYNDINDNLIMSVAIPPHSGYTSQYQNIGQTSNRGVEVTLNANLINKKSFQFSGNFNIAFNQNRVDRIDSHGGNFNSVSGVAWDYGNNEYLVQVGRPLGLMYGYVSDGMYTFDDYAFNQSTKSWVLNPGVADISTLTGSDFLGNGPGHIKVKDISGPNGVPDGKITEDDRTIIGNAQPKFTGGFGFNMSFKNFDCSALFNFKYGGDILNATKVQYTSYLYTRKYQNLSTQMDMAHRFTTIDPATGLNIYSGANANPELLKQINQNATMWNPFLNRTIFTSWVVEDGSYIRFSNFTVGYTLPQKLTKKFLIEKFRLYATGNNIYCWSKYTGQDPEVSMNTRNPMTPGIDNNAYPKSRTLVLGANITF